MMKDDSVYLQHIIDAITRIEEYTSNVDFEHFTNNHLVQDGVIRQMEIIGEAVRRLSETIKNAHQSVPWKDIIGMRNKLIHDYLGIDVDAVWDTVEKDIPYLKTEIQKIINK